MRAVLGQCVEPLDRRGFLVAAGVALGGHDDGHRVIIRPGHRHLIEPPFGASQQQVQRLRAEPQHQHLTFRVAEAHVVFHQPRAPALDHQPGIEHTLERGAAPRHLVYGGLHDLAHRLRFDLGAEHRCG